MIKYFFLLILTFFSGLSSYSCINETRALITGKQVETHEQGTVAYGNDLSDKDYYQSELKELDSLWKTNKKIEDLNDYGVVLIYLGRYPEAMAVFQQAEKIKPGLYSTAANIGNTYELLGKNDSALLWIKKAVAIDPSSHEGSEWLHVKILEAKIKGDKYVNSDFLINTDFGNDIEPKTKLDSTALDLLKMQIYYQLRERMTFIKPKDRIVGLLLFELGNITALNEDVTTALRNYDNAYAYGYDSDVMTKRYHKFRSLQVGLKNEYTNEREEPALVVDKQKSKSRTTVLIVSAAFVLLILLLLRANRKEKNVEES
jgi:tetratricopeptide (TPR) repeat protein